jgi:hypothetical protein
MEHKRSIGERLGRSHIQHPSREQRRESCLPQIRKCHVSDKPTETKPLARRTLPWRGAMSSSGCGRLIHKEGDPFDQLTQTDAGRTPAAQLFTDHDPRLLTCVEQFAKHFGKSPDKLGPDNLRSYQAYSVRACRVEVKEMRYLAILLLLLTSLPCGQRSATAFH